MSKCLKLLISSLLVLVFLQNTGLCQANSSFSLGTALYKQKQYIPAAAHFMTAWKDDSNNAQAAYYGAYCLYLGGQKDSAIKSFWLVSEHFPNRKEGLHAKEFLKRIDPEYAKHKGNPKSILVTATSPGSKSAATKSSTVSTKPTTKKLTNEQIVESMVVVPRPRGKIPAVTPSFVKSIKAILVTLPRPVLLMMEHRKAIVNIVPNLVEADYRMQNVRPRGYSEGSSWQNSSAMCSGRNLYIAQYRLDSSTGNYVNTNTEIGSIRHETGHCVDYCLGYVSQQDKFRHAYRLDAARVPSEHRSRLDYFLQVSSGGPSETFAELCCHRFGGETDTWRIETCNLVKKYFKGPDAILEGYLKGIEERYKDE